MQPSPTSQQPPPRELAHEIWFVVQPEGMMETRAVVDELDTVIAQALDPSEETHCAL